MRSRYWGLLLAVSVAAGAPLQARATGLLEIPAAGSVQTGVGAISGWFCGTHAIRIAIDNQPGVLAGSGTPRADTADVCGGQSDSGFSLLFNFNTLPAGAHTAVAFADGLEFARNTFSTVTLGSEFISGLSGRVSLRNFPQTNSRTVVKWDEPSQNFTIVSSFDAGTQVTTSGGRINGTYYGASGGQNVCDLPSGILQNPKFAQYQVTLTGSSLSLTAENADGTSCTLSGATRLAEDGYLVVDQPTGSCVVGPNPAIRVDGIRLKGGFGAAVNCEQTAFYATKAWQAD